MGASVTGGSVGSRVGTDVGRFVRVIGGRAEGAIKHLPKLAQYRNDPINWFTLVAWAQ